MIFDIKLADCRIRVSSIYDYIKEYSKDYVLAEQEMLLENTGIDFEVAVEPSDIVYEREKSKQEDKKQNVPIRSFTDAYLETLAVYRKIADGMLSYDTILFHGSAIAVDGEGYLFTAKSGTGKSTHTRLWRETFGDRASMINDDKPLLQIQKDQVMVYGTPWDGKHRLSTNLAVPLKGICILERAKYNHIEPTDRRSAYPMLLQQTHRQTEPAALKKTMDLLDRMSAMVPLYKLSCTMEPAAARVAYEGMQR